MYLKQFAGGTGLRGTFCPACRRSPARCRMPSMRAGARRQMAGPGQFGEARERQDSLRHHLRLARYRCVRAAKGVEEAGAALGWTVRTIDGQGDRPDGTTEFSRRSRPRPTAYCAAVPPMMAATPGESLGRKDRRRFGVQSAAAKKDDVFAYVRPVHTDRGQAGRRLGRRGFQGQRQRSFWSRTR